MKNLTVVISAHNEEKKIKDCIKSVLDVAQEIIVIDSSSTDKTSDIANKYTKNVLPRPNNPMLNTNKNFGFAKATGDWILSLDADERLSQELALEISQIINNSAPQDKADYAAYKIPRKNIIFGKWIEHTGWYPDYQTRLFKREKGKFDEKHNHEQLSVDGEIGILESNLEHDHYATIDEFLRKTFFYTTNEADQKIAKGYKFKAQDLLMSPFEEFLSRYFAREGYKDGVHGLALSLLMSFYHLTIILRVWEHEKFEDSSKDTRILVEKASHAMKKDLTHWNREIDIKEMSGFKKTIAKVKRKISS